MWTLGNIIIGGLITGSIYALLAVGYSLVFSVSGALNLAQGAFVALGALTMYTFMNSAHLPVVAAFLASVLRGRSRRRDHRVGRHSRGGHAHPARQPADDDGRAAHRVRGRGVSHLGS